MQQLWTHWLNKKAAGNFNDGQFNKLWGQCRQIKPLFTEWCQVEHKGNAQVKLILRICASFLSLSTSYFFIVRRRGGSRQLVSYSVPMIITWKAPPRFRKVPFCRRECVTMWKRWSAWWLFDTAVYCSWTLIFGSFTLPCSTSPPHFLPDSTDRARPH